MAARTELPCAAVKDHSRFLSDLHLNSIAVGQLVAEAARSLRIAPPREPTALANATVAEAAQALEELALLGRARSPTRSGRSRPASLPGSGLSRSRSRNARGRELSRPKHPGPGA